MANFQIQKLKSALLNNSSPRAEKNFNKLYYLVYTLNDITCDNTIYFHEGTMLEEAVLNKVLFTEKETRRLYIRSYSEIDYQDSLSLYSDPILTRFFDHGKPRSREEIDIYLTERTSHSIITETPLGLFSVFLKDSNTFIGQIDAVPTEEPGEVEIGWIFHKGFQGLGYCSEAVNYFLIPFVKELSENKILLKGIFINRIIATAHPDNLASNKIILKSGLTLYKKALRFGGNPRNWYELKLGNHYGK